MSCTLVFAFLALAGCGGGFSLEKVESDPSIITGGVTPGADAVDPIRLSDEATIRNAVSSADMEAATFTPLSWANASTGSRGTITRLVERKQEGRLCRSFTTSRESFDGVALFSGETCMVGDGIWRMFPLRPH